MQKDPVTKCAHLMFVDLMRGIEEASYQITKYDPADPDRLLFDAEKANRAVEHVSDLLQLVYVVLPFISGNQRHAVEAPESPSFGDEDYEDTPTLAASEVTHAIPQ